MFRTPIVVLAVMACTQARPHLQSFVPLVPASSGTSNSGITRGETVTPFGEKSTITNHQSITGGEALNGGFNFGTASSDTQSLDTPHGTSSTSNTDTQSEQGSSSIFDGLGAGIVLPTFPVLHGLGSSSAKGQSGSNIVTGETIGPNGKSTITKQQSGTGGQAFNGGFNFGTASSDTQSLDTPHGNSRTSNSDGKSVQTSNPTFAIGGGSPVLPIVPVIPIFDFGSATGSANSGLTQGKTVGADGSQSTVTVLGSSASGSAENGGTSVNKASGSTSSIDGISGSQTQSDLDTQSIQTGR